MKIKSMYSNDVVSMVVSLYGTESDIYKYMISGKQISGLVKADIKKKGRNSYKRIKDKKELLKKCLDFEMLLIENVLN